MENKWSTKPGQEWIKCPHCEITFRVRKPSQEGQAGVSADAVAKLVAKWRDAVKHGYISNGTVVMSQCADELALLAAHNQKVRETTRDGWIQIRTSFYEELLSIASQKEKYDSTE